jgi:Co/Zn/Cd efflux system component
LLVSRWPDIIVGGIIASLFLSSAIHVLSQAIRALRPSPAPAAQVVKPVADRLSKIMSR